jgi:D-threo-aldose 1-dehydrogenase
MYAAVDAETAVATVMSAYEAGVRFFDTAPLYGHGSSEDRLGTAIRGLDRAALTVSTKVGRLLVRHTQPIAPDVFVDPYPYEPVFDFTERGTITSLRESMRRLGVVKIDIALIHDPDEGKGPNAANTEADHFEEAITSAYPALLSLRQEGLVGAIGVAMNQNEMLCNFAVEGDFDCFLLAGRYTLLDQSALSIQAAALQFPLGHPNVVSVIPGARTPVEVAANARFFDEPIPRAFWDELQERALIRRDAPIPPTQ